MPARFALRVFSFEVPMPVPSTINDLSTTAGDNWPKGNENPFPLNDDFLRTIQAFIAALRDGKLDASLVSAFMLTVLNDADAATARATLGAAGLGANTFTGAQTLPGNASSALHAVPKQQLDAAIATKADLAGSGSQQFSVASASSASHAVALGQFDKSLGASGYFNLPGGILVQWGSHNAAGSSTATFPTPFSAPPYVIVATDTGAANYAYGCSVLTASNFVLSGAGIARWLAIGPA